MSLLAEYPLKYSALKPCTHKKQNRVSKFISVFVHACVHVSVGVLVIIKVKEEGAINFSVREHGKSWMKRAREMPEGGIYKKGKLGDSILIENVQKFLKS